MNRPASGVNLKDENTGPFCKQRIVLHYLGCGNAIEHVSGKYIIVSQTIVAVLGNANATRCDKFLYEQQRFAHGACLPFQCGAQAVDDVLHGKGGEQHALELRQQHIAGSA